MIQITAQMRVLVAIEPVDGVLPASMRDGGWASQLGSKSR